MHSSQGKISIYSRGGVRAIICAKVPRDFFRLPASLLILRRLRGGRRLRAFNHPPSRHSATILTHRWLWKMTRASFSYVDANETLVVSARLRRLRQLDATLPHRWRSQWRRQNFSCLAQAPSIRSFHLNRYRDVNILFLDNIKRKSNRRTT